VRILLLSEARGEFLLVERIRDALGRRGIESRHVTALATDLSTAEAAQSAVDALEHQPECIEAMRLDGAELAHAVEREQQALGLNLRRVWQADMRSWREGHGDDEMARIAVGYSRALRRILEDERPTAVWGEDGGHLCKQLGYALCRPLGIELLFLWAGPLPGRIVLYGDVLASNDRAEFEAFQPTPDELAYAAEFVDSVRTSRVQYTFSRDMSLRPSRFTNFARLLAQRYVTRPPGAESLHPWRFAQLYFRQRARAARLRRFYRPVGSRPFVFYPVHVANDTQISVRAHEWANQMALIEHLAVSLPYGYELAIKEHPFQVGALPPHSLHALLARRPEIRLLDPTTHAHAVIPLCAALATINSTAGFEGLFFGKPVITFGHSSYRGLGLTFDVVDPFETPQVVLDALGSDGPAPDDVIRLAAFLYRRSTPGYPLSVDTSDANVEYYAERIARHLSEPAAQAASGRLAAGAR